jgi:hypothetical protein
MSHTSHYHWRRFVKFFVSCTHDGPLIRGRYLHTITSQSVFLHKKYVAVITECYPVVDDRAPDQHDCHGWSWFSFFVLLIDNFFEVPSSENFLKYGLQCMYIERVRRNTLSFKQFSSFIIIIFFLIYHRVLINNNRITKCTGKIYALMSRARYYV